MDTNSRHRAATMLLLFVLLLGGLGLLTADLSAGQPFVVTGIITDAANATRLPGVAVSLLDAHGQKDPVTIPSALDGTYTFTPTSGFYRITVETPGYFDNETEIFRFDNNADLRIDIEMGAMPPASIMLTVHVGDGPMNITGADVEVSNITASGTQSLGKKTTNATGNTTFFVWAGMFEIKVDKTGFETSVTVESISIDPAVVSVDLDPALTVFGNAQVRDGPFVSQGLVAFLYDLNTSAPQAKRLLVANVTGSLYTFSAYPGDFIRIVDADGMAANITQITVSPTGSADISVNLTDSPEERVDTVIQYSQGDWNRLHLWRNLTFNNDTTFPGLPFAFIRHLRLQIDLALGDGDGTLDATEREAFRTNLTAAGPKHVDTENFFTTNSEAYRSDLNGMVTDYNVSISGLDLPSGAVQVTSLANYTAIDPTIAVNQEKYYVNITASHDTDAEVRVNMTYKVQAVPSYERETQTITGAVDIQSYVRIVVDPLVAPGTFRVDMEVAKSLSGTARVLVVAPADRFTETNVSVDNYTAIVPRNVSMTFSAEDSTDPNSPDGKINPESNFNWTFNGTTIPQNETAFGLRPDVTFSVMGNYSGNLTIVEVGGNETFRHFNVSVDGILPLARLENNVTGFGIDANNTIIIVNEGDIVEFFGGNSTDRVHDQMMGVVLEYRWDFNGDGSVDVFGPSPSVDWTFDEPGEFTVNLTVVDQAGHESLNATMTAMVADTSPPEVEFRILDDDFQEVTSLVEQVTYLFDGSDTTDNLDGVANMTFEWDFGDDATATGLNVTHMYADNGNFDVVLTVTDQAGNEGNATRSIVVGVDPETRPDLEIEPNIMLIDPASPEESTFLGVVVLFISFNVTNVPGRAPANDVQVTFFAFQFGQSPGAPEEITPVFKDVSGVPTNNTLAPGEIKVVEFTWITGPLGNYTLRANVTDPEEPDLFIGPRNTVELQLDVREAAWKQPLLIGSIIAIIVGIPVALFLRRRLRGRGRERITR
ncbi:MAG: PKD domain-containing protein [Thermoplasmata archaeon]